MTCHSSPRRLARRLAVAVAVVVAAAGHLAAQDGARDASGVFRQYADRVTRIQVVEAGSDTQISVGSGFFVDDEGHLITNYHVIADVVHHPERYRVELGERDEDGDTVTLIGVDAVHDLAVLRASSHPRPHFTLGDVGVEQGDRLYALGHPRDLGLSIVEGTYNGLLEHTLYPKLHFTGSLNPGMSGGPTITADGRVVGVNVSTAGNQLSFLVPVDRALELARRVTADGYRPPERFLDDVGEQIRAYQDVYLEGLFTDAERTVELGPFRAVTKPADFFRCWSDVPWETDEPYERAHHRCSTDDEVYIARDQKSGIVELTHELVTSESLNAVRFAALYTSILQQDNTPYGAEEHVTNWRCTTRNVHNDTTPLRVVLCLRGYRKLEGLYDGVVKVAVLGRRDAGLVSSLKLSGVSFDNLQLLTSRFAEHAAWR